MSRRQSIIIGFLATILLVLLIIMFIMAIPRIPKKEETETQLPEREGIVIDGHNIEVVYDDYGAGYLKYVIGPMKTIYIPIPPEAELPDDTDSLKFYYTKNQKRWEKSQN